MSHEHELFHPPNLFLVEVESECINFILHKELSFLKGNDDYRFPKIQHYEKHNNNEYLMYNYVSKIKDKKLIS